MTTKKLLLNFTFELLVELFITALSITTNAISTPFHGDMAVNTASYIHHDTDLRKEALLILKKKCNTCHRRQNPRMVFDQNNMVKRAPKIRRQVVELKRMPKKGGEPLTQEEYNKLKSWLETH